MTLNLDDLEEKARGAVAGPWHVVEYGDGDSLVIHYGDEHRICFMATHGGSQREWQRIQANAAFIAAANPETILGLISEARL